MAKKDGGKSRNRSERFEVEQTMTRADAADYLEGLARGLREGNIALGEDSNGFRASIAPEIDFEVTARRGKRKSRVAMTMAFRTDGAAPETQATEDPGEPRGDAMPTDTIPDEMSF